MKLPDWLKALPWKIIGIAALILAIWLFFQIRSCQQSSQHAAENRLNQGQMGALTNSAADAVNTQGAANERERQSEDLTRSNEREIRHAQGADVAVNPDLNASGLRAQCRRAAYRDSERCRLLRTSAP